MDVLGRRPTSAGLAIVLVGSILVALQVTSSTAGAQDHPVPLVRYDFTEGSGSTVADTGAGSALDLSISDPSSVTWLPGGGLRVDAPVILSSGGPATEVIDAVKASGAITVEAWVRAANTTQEGPARIASISSTSFSRNLTLGQGQSGNKPTDTYEARLRTTATDANGRPALTTEAGTATTDLAHVVFTRNSLGAVRVFLDGTEVAISSRSGTFAGWDDSMALLLANEADGTRPWLGTYCRVAFYDQALDSTQVAANHTEGCTLGDEPPVDEPPVDEPPVDEPPVDEPPVDEPPVDEPPVDEPPVDEPPVGDGPSVGPVADQLNLEGEVVAIAVAATDPEGIGLSFSATGLPPGLTVDPSTGVVSGTVSAGAGEGSPYPVKVIVVDSTGSAASTSFFWTIGQRDGWWSPAHALRIPLTVSPDGVERQDRVILIDLDLAAALAGQALDLNSLRIVEHAGDDLVIATGTPFQFDPVAGFHPLSDPRGTLAILLAGATAADEARYFHLYLDTAGGPAHTPAGVAGLVSPVATVDDEGQESFRVQTQVGTWSYHLQGGGFSSLDDTEGNDWISYSQATGSAGKFRGIPNLVHPEGHFHPGATTSDTTLVQEGPVRATFESVAAGGWRIRWDLYPHYATATVLEAPEAYWFLYEGTPGGVLEATTDTVTRSGAITTPLSQTWKRDLPDPEWAYFTDPGLGRSLFVAAHDADAATDSYRTMNGVMTVFGLGRSNLVSGLVGPRSFSVGLVDGPQVETVLASASRPVTVTVAAAESNPVPPPPPRTVDGLVLLYDFDEGAGTVVNDTSGVSPALDLTVKDTSRTTWVPEGLRLDRATTVTSTDTTTKVNQAVAASGELTIEAWIRPENLVQNGPARIATISDNASNRNVTLGQGEFGASADRIEVRARTTTTNLNGQPSTVTPAGTLSADTTHVVYSRTAQGATSIWIDGALVGTGQVGGNLSNWGDYRLALGDEFGGLRPWLGTYFLLAVFDRALTPEEVATNFAAGPSGDGTYPNLAPVATLTSSAEVGSAPLPVTFDAGASFDPDGAIVSYAWTFDSTTASGPMVSHTFEEPGAYPVTVTVTDDGGAQVQASATVLVLSDDVSGAVSWTRLTAADGDLELPGTQPQQTVAVVGDISGDGLNDFVIGSRFGTEGPSVVWYERHGSGWTKRLVEPDLIDVEAGGVLADLDGDGDLDLVIGEGSTGRRMYWWENPGPAQTERWTRRLVKDGGDTQHHDQAIGDIDGDGQLELAYWNNRGAQRLLVADVPEDPTIEPWPATTIFTAPVYSEGLALADIDGDGVEDIVAGGHWFRHIGGGAYETQVIDTEMAFTKVAAGQLIDGGRPEVVFDSGDTVGSLRLYEWDGAAWIGRTLLPQSGYGHSLNLGDVNADGHLDIMSGEMKFPDFTDPVLRILYGDGSGNFSIQEVARGVGNHESKLADLDGDGDLDILGKPFRVDVPGLNVWLNEGSSTVAVDSWNRHVPDSSVPWRTIFVDHGDIDGDGLEDVISGGWWWRNPGTAGGSWVRAAIGSPLNQMAVVADFDADGDLDVLGTEAMGSEANPNFRWARNDGSGNFTVHDNVEAAVGSFLQGVTVAEFEPGRLEVALSWQNGNGGLQMLTVPDAADVTTQTWTWRQVHPTVSGEGLDSGDIDGDGDADIVDGANWFRNDGAGQFTRLALFGPEEGEPDRNILVDMDGDGDLDLVVGYGHDPQGKVAWYEQGPDPEAFWTEHLVASVSPANPQSVDVADLDGDGDMDIVVGEHTNPDAGGMRALVLENVGGGFWVTHVIFTGDEHHDGMQLVDLDGDGDLDVVSVGWTHRRLLIYENLGAG